MAFDLNRIPGESMPGHSEFPTLDSLVIQDQPAAIPKEDLFPVESLAEENEEMPAERVVLPLILYNRHQPIVPASHVNWF